jgi:hypothetical protein
MAKRRWYCQIGLKTRPRRDGRLAYKNVSGYQVYNAKELPLAEIVTTRNINYFIVGGEGVRPRQRKILLRSVYYFQLSLPAHTSTHPNRKGAGKLRSDQFARCLRTALGIALSPGEALRQRDGSRPYTIRAGPPPTTRRPRRMSHPHCCAWHVNRDRSSRVPL